MKIFGGTPVSGDPALGIQVNKQKIIRQMKKAINPHGVGIEGIEFLSLKNFMIFTAKLSCYVSPTIRKQRIIEVTAIYSQNCIGGGF